MEVNTLPSETQPDEVLSIREMIERHARGLPVNVNDQGQYYDEELGYIPSLKELDLSEMDDLRDRYKKQAEDLDAEYKKREADEKEAKAQKAKADKEEKEFLKSLRKNQKSAEGDRPLSGGGHKDSDSDLGS